MVPSRVGFELVGARGFEPPTPCAQGRCATRLRYAPILCLSYSTSLIEGRKNFQMPELQPANRLWLRSDWLVFAGRWHLVDSLAEHSELSFGLVSYRLLSEFLLWRNGSIRATGGFGEIGSGTY